MDRPIIIQGSNSECMPGPIATLGSGGDPNAIADPPPHPDRTVHKPHTRLASLEPFREETPRADHLPSCNVNGRSDIIERVDLVGTHAGAAEESCTAVMVNGAVVLYVDPGFLGGDVHYEATGWSCILLKGGG